MGVLIRIALRNLLEHRAKTLIIGIIIAVGVLVIIDGNAFLDRAQVGVKKTFTENFTGDMYVYGRSETPTSILFGKMDAAAGTFDTPLLPDFNAINEYLRSRPEIEKTTGLVTSVAMFNVEDKGEVNPGQEKSGDEEAGTSMLGGAILMGIDPESYRQMFDNVTILEGEYLQPGQTGLMLSRKRLDMMGNVLKVTLNLGDQIIMQGFGSGGFKARKVPIVGIFESKAESDANEFMAFTDVNTVRMLAGLTVGGANEVEIPDSTRALIAVEDEDDIFGTEETVDSGSSLGAITENVAEAAAAPRPAIAADTGAWQYILIRLKNPATAASTIASINMYFFQNNINAMAGDWKGAASPFSQSIDVVRFVLTFVIIILAVVAIIIIMNTLVVSVIERTGEIGTMRALGAQKGFVWKMFFIETLCITFTFGFIGVVLSWLSMTVINLIGFQATNSFLEVLFGGKVLEMSLSAGSVVGILVMVSIVSIAAHIYPVMVALRIQPVRAMQTE